MVQALERALKLLEVVAEDPGVPKALSQLALSVSLHPATCAHIMKTLVACGYVEQLGHKKGYTLGPAAYRLSARGPYRRDLVRRLEPLMKKLAQDLRETVVLAAMRDGRRITLHEIDGGADVQIRRGALQEDSLWQTAGGRVLIAGLPEDQLAVFINSTKIPAADWPEAATKEKLRKELERIRQEGLSLVHRGEIVGVARPIVENGRTIAALGVFLPAFRFVSPHREKTIEALGAAVSAASMEKKENRRS
jgi:DNA-binding IclR family transcriptional regulator